MSEKTGIYSGPSEGFGSIADGYVDYGIEVIARRALPDVRDGLKPVQRRIIYSAWEHRQNFYQKGVTFVSNALKLHPHGDNSVWGSLALMSDENGTWNVPIFDGKGNLGKVYSSAKPAAMRYPKLMLNSNVDDFFKDKETLELVTSEEGDGVEPTVLPATYPIVLVNGAEGIAVSVGTKMPSFNFGDVIDLTIKRIKNGKLELSDMIVPDFPTGGILVCNNAEIAKIMATGKGKLKVRAKVEIIGKKIIVNEVPIGKTVEGIIRAIKNSDMANISDVYESIGKDSTSLITITCKSKKVVEETLMELYRRNILQNVFASSILVIEDGEPKILGVHGIIDTWYNWRVETLKKKFNILINGLQGTKKTLDYFLRLISNEEWKDTYVYKATKTSKQEANDYLVEIFEDIPYDICNWIYERSISAFNKGGIYKTRYENILKEEQQYYEYLNNLDEYIINELEEIKRGKAGKYARKTEITYQDYKFSKITESDEVEDTSFCVYTLLKNGFLLKTREAVNSDEVLCQINGRANSILIGFDNFGRILRVIGKEIPFTIPGESGVYMPKYFEATFQEDYKVLYLSLLDGSKKMLVYRDGYVGFFDTSEYVGKKNIKTISKGVCTAVYDKLLEVYEEEDIPQYILLADDSKSKLRMGVVITETIPERSRLSRAKVLSGTDIDTYYLKGFNNFELAEYIENPNDLVGKLKVFKGQFYGAPEEMLDGTYLELCKDFDEAE